MSVNEGKAERYAKIWLEADIERSFRRLLDELGEDAADLNDDQLPLMRSFFAAGYAYGFGAEDRQREDFTPASRKRRPRKSRNEKSAGPS